jgi:nicotinamidase-related amidase
MTAGAMTRLARGSACLLVVDVQERLCAAMEPAALERVLARTGAAVKGAQALGLPVLVTEQYPKGLGATHPQLRALLEGAPTFEKMEFSAATPAVLEAQAGRTQVLLAGMETHICVFQTVRDLAERGLAPVVLADAVLSRHGHDREVGYQLCREAGGSVRTVESVLFDLLGRAGTPEFKLVSQAVR